MVEYIPCCTAPALHWCLLPATRLASRKILMEQNIKKRTGPALWLLCGYDSPCLFQGTYVFIKGVCTGVLTRRTVPACTACTRGGRQNRPPHYRIFGKHKREKYIKKIVMTPGTEQLDSWRSHDSWYQAGVGLMKEYRLLVLGSYILIAIGTGKANHVWSSVHMVFEWTVVSWGQLFKFFPIII